MIASHVFLLLVIAWQNWVIDDKERQVVLFERHSNSWYEEYQKLKKENATLLSDKGIRRP